MERSVRPRPILAALVSILIGLALVGPVAGGGDAVSAQPGGGCPPAC